MWNLWIQRTQILKGSSIRLKQADFRIPLSVFNIEALELSSGTNDFWDIPIIVHEWGERKDTNNVLIAGTTVTKTEAPDKY